MLRQLTRRPSIYPPTRLSLASARPNARHLLRPTGLSNAFHSTPQRRGGPLVPIFVTMLKASTSLELARMAGRIALTFMPLIVLKRIKYARKIKYAAVHGTEATEEQKEKMSKQMWKSKLVLYGLLFVPLSLFWATIVASLERTPLTGRWRMIILSPEEEDEIASQLAGQGWYNAVGEILAQDGPPRLIPSTDWRYQWVNETLRKLEATIPVLTNEPKLHPQWLSDNHDSPPMPPPADFPLRPRARVSEYLHWICEQVCEGHNKKPLFAMMPAHTIQGPPYSLIVVDKPDASNAFSYGFGPNGAGGIVVYSGFLDDVLARTPLDMPTAPPVEDQSWLSWVFGGFLSGPRTKPLHPTPTPEQTSELAILMAHELSHLILAHHLESLSSSTVIVPGTVSIITDIVRVVIFPITMLFGPFVNDALAQLGKVGSLELSKVGEQCTSMKQEIEADVVSARLLAHAGFDAREAVKFWEVRSSTLTERVLPETDEMRTGNPVSENLVRRIMGSTHPVSEIRVERLKEELDRWEMVRQSVVSDLRASQDA